MHGQRKTDGEREEGAADEWELDCLTERVYEKERGPLARSLCREREANRTALQPRRVEELEAVREAERKRDKTSKEVRWKDI